MLSISTKTGDKGTTSLANGQRLSKDDVLFEIIGTLDELNSWLGLAIAKMRPDFPTQVAFLLELQDTLFYVGAEVAQSPAVKLDKKKLAKLESEAERLQESMKEGWHTKFTLPGGTELGGYLDVARTVCRRCERRMILLHQEEKLNPVLVQYINRLSDYLYLLRCYVNHALEYPEQLFEAS